MDIDVTFKDKFGNVVLPGLGRKIKIHVINKDGDTLQGELVDKFDGTYSKRIQYALMSG